MRADVFQFAPVLESGVKVRRSAKNGQGRLDGWLKMLGVHVGTIAQRQRPDTLPDSKSSGEALSLSLATMHQES